MGVIYRNLVILDPKESDIMEYATGTMRGAALGAVVFGGLFGSAMAAPVNFTWSPAAVGLTTTPGTTNIVNANNYNVADFASVTINPTTGAFTETGDLNILNFLNGGSTVPSIGLGGAVGAISGYSLYIKFTAAGSQGPIPTVTGTSTNGAFSSLNYTLIGTPNGSPPVNFAVSNGAVAITDPGPDLVLAHGSLIPGHGFITLTKTNNGFSPSANVDLTFVECGAAVDAVCTTGNESAFFVSPLSGLSLQTGNFGATDTVATLVAGNPTFLNIDGGGGNLTFVSSVPEPASLAIIGSGLMGLAAALRRRRRI
jgi:hypothetical protein